MKKQGVFDESTYENIYPVGSQPSRLHGTPKLHKSITNVPPLLPIVSSVNNFNYNLAKYLCNLLQYLCNLLQLKIPSIYSTQGMFTFVKELEEVRGYNNFLALFDVCSLLTNILLNETIELALGYILSNNPDVNISWKDLKKLLHFATFETLLF